MDGTGAATTLSAAIGRTRHTAPLLDGAVPSPSLHLVFEPFPVISRAFAPMVRDQRFDVSEMAIGTFLQARAAGSDLVLLPAVLAQRFQEGALLCRRDGEVTRPEDLAGRRVGVRAYGQTTALWLRGTLSDRYGVAANSMRWVTFEDAHVAGIADPPWAERAPPNSDMLSMLKDGRLDAAIFGNDTPADPALRTVVPDPAEAADAFRARHGLVPVNHMLCLRRVHARAGVVPELMRLVEASFAASGAPPLPLGLAAVRKAVALAGRFAAEQGLLPRPLDEAEVWDGLPEAAKQGVMP